MHHTKYKSLYFDFVKFDQQVCEKQLVPLLPFYDQIEIFIVEDHTARNATISV